MMIMEIMVLNVLETSCGHYPPHNNIVPRLDNSEVAEISDPWCSDIPQFCKNVCGVSPPSWLSTHFLRVSVR